MSIDLVITVIIAVLTLIFHIGMYYQNERQSTNIERYKTIDLTIAVAIKESLEPVEKSVSDIENRLIKLDLITEENKKQFVAFQELIYRLSGDIVEIQAYLTSKKTFK